MGRLLLKNPLFTFFTLAPTISLAITSKEPKTPSTAPFTISQSLEIIQATLDNLTTTLATPARAQPSTQMYGNQQFHYQPVLIPSPSSAHPLALIHKTMATMNVDRSASPATSGDTASNGLSPLHNPLSPGDNGDGGSPGKGRSLSNSKRAEQNRRAQRAFRERRDSRIKFLEARAELLNESIAQAEEAHRRWEECRALVDQLRHENAMLRAALDNAGVSAEGIPSVDVHSTNNSENGMDLPGLNGQSNGHANGVEIHSTLREAVAESASGPSKKRKRRDDGQGASNAAP